MGGRHLVALIAVAIGVGLPASCGGSDAEPLRVGPSEGTYRGSEPPGRITMPEFALHDVVSAKEVDSGALRGKVVLITFIDTDCKESCPLIASAIGDALRSLPPSIRQKASAFAISVNPVIDTRRKVRRFLRQRRAEAITYLSGSVAELKRVWKRF